MIHEMRGESHISQLISEFDQELPDVDEEQVHAQLVNDDKYIEQNMRLHLLKHKRKQCRSLDLMSNICGENSSSPFAKHSKRRFSAVVESSKYVSEDHSMTRENCQNESDAENESPNVAKSSLQNEISNLLRKLSIRHSSSPAHVGKDVRAQVNLESVQSIGSLEFIDCLDGEHLVTVHDCAPAYHIKHF